VTESYFVTRDRRDPFSSWGWESYSYTSAGTMAADAIGIVGTPDSGATFFWLRQ
jgi:hypothetical protein